MADATHFTARERVAIAFKLLAIAWLVLAIATFAARPTSFAMPIIAIALALVWLVAAALARRNGAARLFIRPDAGACLLLTGGTILCTELVIRLACASNFGGHPASFDFGLKCTAAMANTSCEHSVAFTPEFNSVGHCLQGALSMLLLPEIERRAAIAIAAATRRAAQQPPLLVRL